MSNWSTYQQKISPAFRSVAQAIQNHYTANDISFELFDAKSATDIQTDLQALTADSPIYLEYAKSVLSYAVFTPAEYGSVEGLKYSMLTRDQAHYTELETHLSSVYTDFTVLQSEVAEDLAAQIYTAAASSDFLLKLGEMLLAVKNLSIWERFKLNFSMLEDKEAEHLVNMINDAGEANINSFRLLSQLSSSALATVIESFSTNNIYLNSVASGIQSRAKVIYTQFGESDPNAELWSEYYDSLPAAKKSPIELIKETGSISTVYELANMEFSSLVALLSVDFFSSLSPYYKKYIDYTFDVSSFQYRFIGQLVDDTNESKPLENWKINALDANDTEYGSVALSNTTSNKSGHFNVFFSSFSENLGLYQLDFTLTNPKTNQVIAISKNYNGFSPSDVVEFVINVESLVDSAQISAVEASDVDIEILPELSAYLSNNNISRLEDIRKIGGLFAQADLPSGVEDVAARLDAHASLELLKSDKVESIYLVENAKLINKGFSSVRKITQTNRYDFVNTAKEAFATSSSTGQYNAGKVFEQASGMINTINQRINSGLSKGFKDYSEDLDIKNALREITNDSCQCNDCKSGVSPLAYLSDLINYTLKSVNKAPYDVELAEIESSITLISGDEIETVSGTELSIDLPSGPTITIDYTALTLPSGVIIPLDVYSPQDSSYTITLPDASTAMFDREYGHSLISGDVIYFEGPVFVAKIPSGEEIRILDALSVKLPSRVIINLSDNTATLPPQKITLSDLQDFFKHPFADLPADCLSVSKKLCQVRLCIEVLWTHIFNGTTITNSNDLSTSDELKEIRLRTYEFLLTEIGTSYDEIRKIRLASVEEREKFADRLGIPENTLDEFILDHSSANDQINDVIIEELFGYRDTTRNYKTIDSGDVLPNALVANPKSKLEEYREDHLKVKFNEEDFPDRPFSSLALPIIDPDVISADDFRNTLSTNSAFTIWQKRFDFLSDTIAELKTFKRKASTFPKSKQLIVANLPSTTSALTSVVVVGPTGTSVSLTPIEHNFQPDGQTVITVAETPPFALEPNSVITVDGSEYNQGGEVLDDLSTDHENGGGIPNQKSIFSRMKEPFVYEGVEYTPWIGLPSTNHEEYFELLYGNLRNTQYYSDTVNTLKNSFGLEEAEFLRLYELYTINKIGAEKHEASKLTNKEWEETLDLMLVSIKRKLQTAWITEEGSMSIGPENFWESITEPIVASSPFPYESTYFDQSIALPLVDPDLVNEVDLPDITAGAEGIALYAARKGEITSAKSTIRLTRIQNETDADNGFGSLLNIVYGTTLSGEIDNTYNDLNSTDPNLHFDAEGKIVEEYLLTVEQFSQLIKVRDKANIVNPSSQPTEDEWDRLYGDLLNAYKTYNLYPDWLSHEKDTYYDGANTTWKLRKSSLPKWRSNLSLRKKWKEELAMASRQPIIDPYLINPIYMKDFGEGVNTLSVSNRVLQLWDDRRDDMEAIRQSALVAVAGTALLSGVDTKIQALIGVSIADFLLIKDQQEAGLNVKGRLNQLGLSFETYERLYKLRGLAESEGDNAFTESEKEDFGNILTDVYKKKYFGEWNNDERTDTTLNAAVPFALSNDYFRENPKKAFEFPPKVEDEKPKYLFNQKSFKKWESKLQARIGELELNRQETRRIVKNTEEAMLIATREAIIKHMADTAPQVLIEPEDPQNPGATRPVTITEMKDYINRNLLIDAEIECCSPTTRVTQAIESLQVLLWGMHNQVLLDEEDIKDLLLKAPDFEKEWKWLGSYATWRAAMFVQLYPENLLIPQLLPDATQNFNKALYQLDKVRNKADIEAVYSDYFKEVEDIRSIQLLANCKTDLLGKLTTFKGTYRDTNIDCLFTFGKGGNTKKYYFKESHIKKADITVSRQSSWIALPHEITGEFVGVQSCDINDEHLIYFFTSEGDIDDRKLMLSIYDYTKNKWEEKIEVTYEMKENSSLDITHKFFFINKDYNKNHMPFLLVYGYNWAQYDHSNNVRPKTDFQFKSFWFDRNGIAVEVLNNSNDQEPDPNASNSSSQATSGTRTPRSGSNSGSGTRNLTSPRGSSGSINYNSSNRPPRPPRPPVGGTTATIPPVTINKYEDFVPMYIYWEDEYGFTRDDGTEYTDGALTVVGYDVSKQDLDFCKMYFTWWGDLQEIEYFDSQGLLTDDIVARNIVPKLIHQEGVIKNVLMHPDPSNYQLFKATVFDDPYSTYMDDGALEEEGIRIDSGVLRPASMAEDFYMSNMEVGAEKYFFFTERTGGDLVNAAYEKEGFDFFRFEDKKALLSFPLENEYSLKDGKVELNIENLKTFYANLNSGNSSVYLNYIQEAFYYLPLSLSRKLSLLNEYETAKKYLSIIYDFQENEPIYYNLIGDITAIKVDDNWVDNPLNPYDIAAKRQGVLRESFYLQLINYFIGYANHEFTQDTIESIARAKQLYLEAMDLIEEIKPSSTDCDIEYDIQIGENGDTYLKEYWERIKRFITENIHSQTEIDALTADIITRWEANDGSSDLQKMQDVEQLAQTAIVNSSSTLTLKDEIDSMEQKIEQAIFLLSAENEFKEVVSNAVAKVSNQFQTAVLQTTGFTESTIEGNTIDLGFLEVQGAEMIEQEGQEASFEEWFDLDPIDPDTGGTYGEEAMKRPERILQLNFVQHKNAVANPIFGFCVASNPVIRAFDMQVKLNLYKIRNCLNIAGVKRSLDSFVAPIDAITGIPTLGLDGFISTNGTPLLQASPYRFDFLIERSKELINISQNVESAFLSALDKLDEENYSVIRARQDLATAKANVRLQDIRIIEAENGIKLAELQTGRAESQVNGLQEMIDEGFNVYEQEIMNNYYTINDLTQLIDALDFYASIVRTQADLTVPTAGGGTNVASMAAAMPILFMLEGTRQQLSFSRGSLQTRTNIAQMYAAQSRRVQEWNYQKSIANQDVRIGKQQEVLAQNRLRIVNQEKNIALLQQEQSEATIDFLLNQQFTSAALYQYMSEVLERVYSYFLQEATAMAKLAAKQLAFERQQAIPEFIKGDYWVLEDAYSVASSEDEIIDRKGITGSARLLQDIYRLDQYAKQSDQRKQQLRKTISLASMLPFEFQKFRETGLLTFSTDMELFDRDFPGHYLRLIKGVSTSVIALVPPVDGIKASLSSLGLSRVVTGGPLFQEQNIRRLPETVSLSSPISDNGVMELNPDNKFLRPFEGTGVETFWEFRMEKGANPNIDYASIADVIITIDYEALNSFDYRAKVVGELNKGTAYDAMLPISFKQNLPDQWFDMINPDQAQMPYSVKFSINRDNFPVNIENVTLDKVLIYFPQEKQQDKSIRIESFSYSDEDGADLLSLTNQEAPNAQFRVSAKGLPVNGTFELVLQSASIRQMIAEDKLLDILMVITFKGETPKYHL